MINIYGKNRCQLMNTFTTVTEHARKPPISVPLPGIHPSRFDEFPSVSAGDRGFATATLPSQKQALNHSQRDSDGQQQCHGLGLLPYQGELRRVVP